MDVHSVRVIVLVVYYMTLSWGPETVGGIVVTGVSSRSLNRGLPTNRPYSGYISSGTLLISISVNETKELLLLI